MFEIAVCSFAFDILRLQDEQQDDESSSIEKRSLKSTVCYLNRSTNYWNYCKKRLLQ